MTFLSSAHHATLIVAQDRKTTTTSLWEMLHKNSAANVLFEVSSLDIDTARGLRAWAMTPFSDTKVAVISFHTATHPAQNALLKIVEDPPRGVSFIFITSHKESILSTLLSRLCEHTLSQSLDQQITSNDLYNLAKLFLTTQQTERMSLPEISALLEKTDEQKRKDRESVRTFFSCVLETLPTELRYSQYKKEILELMSYSSLPSSNTKALIEYAALLVPKI